MCYLDCNSHQLMAWDTPCRRVLRHLTFIGNTVLASESCLCILNICQTWTRQPLNSHSHFNSICVVSKTSAFVSSACRLCSSAQAALTEVPLFMGHRLGNGNMKMSKSRYLSSRGLSLEEDG